MIIRKAGPGDQGYIAATWMESVLDGPTEVESRAALNQEIDRLLDDRLTRVLVACPESDQWRILGFVVFAGRTLLYLCVRNQERRKGIGKALLREAGLLDKSKPMLYVYDGPDADRVMDMRPDAVKITLQEHLA